MSEQQVKGSLDLDMNKFGEIGCMNTWLELEKSATTP